MEMLESYIVKDVLEEQATILAERIKWSSGNEYPVEDLKFSVNMKLAQMN